MKFVIIMRANSVFLLLSSVRGGTLHFLQTRGGVFSRTVKPHEIRNLHTNKIIIILNYVYVRRELCARDVLSKLLFRNKTPACILYTCRALGI